MTQGMKSAGLGFVFVSDADACASIRKGTLAARIPIITRCTAPDARFYGLHAAAFVASIRRPHSPAARTASGIYMAHARILHAKQHAYRRTSSYHIALHCNRMVLRRHDDCATHIARGAISPPSIGCQVSETREGGHGEFRRCCIVLTLRGATRCDTMRHLAEGRLMPLPQTS
jgi:hypothetical protein